MVTINNNTLSSFNDLVNLIQNGTLTIAVLNTLPPDDFYTLVTTQGDFSTIPAIVTTDFAKFNTLLDRFNNPIINGNFMSQLNPAIFSDPRIMNYKLSLDQALNLIIPANRTVLLETGSQNLSRNAYNALTALINTIITQTPTPYITTTPLPPAYFNYYCYAINDGNLTSLRRTYASKFAVNANISIATGNSCATDVNSAMNIDILGLLNNPSRFSQLLPIAIPLFDFYAVTYDGSIFEAIIYNNGDLQTLNQSQYNAMTTAMKSIVDEYSYIHPYCNVSETISVSDSENDGEIPEPLWIYMGALDCDADSPIFSDSDIQYTSSDISYNFVVDIKIPRASILNTFTYILDSNGATIHLFSNKMAFELVRNYSPNDSCNTIQVTRANYVTENVSPPPVFGDLSSNYNTGFDVIGPVIDKGNMYLPINSAIGFPNKDKVPLTWSYMQYVADNMLGNFAFYSVFNKRFMAEQEIYKNVNNSFTAKLKGIFDPIDISNATHTDYELISVNNTQIGYGYNYDKTRTIDAYSSNIASVLFDALYTKAKKRFDCPCIYETTPLGFNVNGEVIPSINRYSFPFAVGDVIQSLLTINPNASNTSTRYRDANPMKPVVYLLNMRVV